MNTELIKLVLDRLRELSKQVSEQLFEKDKWREPPLTDLQKIEYSVRIDAALNEQREWINAIEDEIE